MENGQIKGIIFDFNGTMFFDEAFQKRAWITFLENKTGRSISEEEFQEYVHGRNAEDTLSFFLQRELSREEVAELEEEKELIYRNLCLNSPEDFKLAEGLSQFLEKLVQREIPITIATASGRNNVRFFFDRLHLEQWFDFDKVVYNDGTIPGKPEPDIYLRAAERMNVTIENCVVFEDAKSGIQAAKRAGAGKIIGVASMLEEEQLVAYGAEITIVNYYSRKLYNMLLCNFPDELDHAKVLEFSNAGDFCEILGRGIRYFAIAQYEGDEGYYLFYCDDCEHEYEVVQDDLFESIDTCKQVASQWGTVVWNRK